MKRRFNLVDAVLIALVLLAGVGAYALRDRSTGADVARETYPMRFTVEFTRVPEDMAKQMAPGKDAYRSTDSAYLGKITEVRCVPHAEYEYSGLAGDFVPYELREKFDVYLTIENDCYSTPRDIVFGTVAPKVCGEMYVKGKGFSRMGYVYDIDTMGAPVAANTAAGSGGVEATYVIRLEDMREALLDAVHVGDRLYERVTNTLLGEVTDVWRETYGETHLGPDGVTAVYAEKEGVYNLYIRVKGRAVEKADGYYLDGGTELKVGASVITTSQYLDRTGVFYALESIEAVK